MLYIIGGGSRCGKTTSANKMLKEKNIPYFSLDYLMMGIANGIPEFGVYPTEGDYITAQRMWKIVNPLMTAMVENRIDYTIEGVQVVPSYMAQFAQKHPGKVKSCFIGLADIDVKLSVEQIKFYSSQTENDGFKHLTHTEIVHQIERIKADSLKIRQECLRYHLKYFESSGDFNKTIDSVVAYLIES
ncbi:adenylate kinase [Paenibacillus agricola]|uniref:Adenylate kinase n=1 Tax=Paenibacillus agricola TaxID=2716264 RepID=A0ABX0JKX2_9BACL|nr:adenylate kinase [Paenibacillus agricola]NHN35304.1 adenylate kinase [Paenibacillus agricola]